MNRLAFVVFTVSLVFTAGCSRPVNIKPDVLDHGSVLIYQGDSGTSSTFLRRPNSKDIMCRGPYVDVVKTQSEQANIGLSILGGAEPIGAGESQGAISLGGMSPEVLIASELLYRACELAANINADKELTLKIYERFLQIVNKTSAHQTEKGAASISLEQNQLSTTPVLSGQAASSDDSDDSDDDSAGDSGDDSGS